MSGVRKSSRGGRLVALNSYDARDDLRVGAAPTGFLRWLGSVDILSKVGRNTAPHLRKSSRAYGKFNAIRFPPRDDLRPLPEGERDFAPSPLGRGQGVRVKRKDINKARWLLD